MSTSPPENPLSDAKTSIQGELDRSDPGEKSDSDVFVPQTPELRRLTVEIAKSRDVAPGGLISARQIVRETEGQSGLPEGTHRVKVPKTVGSEGETSGSENAPSLPKIASRVREISSKPAGLEPETSEPGERLVGSKSAPSLPSLAARVRNDPVGPELAGFRPTVGPDRAGVGAGGESVGTGRETVETDRLGVFDRWCEDKATSTDPRFPVQDVSHNWSNWTARKRYRMLHDVDRFFRQEYEWYTTVHITHVIPRERGESVVEHAEKFMGRTFRRKLRESLKEIGVYQEFAGIGVLAPKTSEGSSPGAEHQPETHAHVGIWIPGRDVRLSDFERLKDVAGDIHISVRNHLSESVENPESVGSEFGDSTALPVEIGSNLPCINAELDARSLPEYAQKWCAEMALGNDGDPETRGIRVFRPLRNGSEGSNFREIAQSEYERRKSGSDGVIELVSRVGTQGKFGENPVQTGFSPSSSGVCSPRTATDRFPPP